MNWSIKEFSEIFPTEESAFEFLVKLRWPNGICCPVCKRTDISFVPTRHLWQCRSRHSKCQFSVKSGTALEGVKITERQWLLIIWLFCDDGCVNSYRLADLLNVTQKTAWWSLYKLRQILNDGEQDHNVILNTFSQRHFHRYAERHIKHRSQVVRKQDTNNKFRRVKVSREEERIQEIAGNALAMISFTKDRMRRGEISYEVGKMEINSIMSRVSKKVTAIRGIKACFTLLNFKGRKS